MVPKHTCIMTTVSGASTLGKYYITTWLSWDHYDIIQYMAIKKFIQKMTIPSFVTPKTSKIWEQIN